MVVGNCGGAWQCTITDDPGLAGQCYAVVEELLVERREYALCAKYIQDPDQRFEQARSVRERGLALVDRSPEGNRSNLRRIYESSFIETSRRLIEILVGIGRTEQALSIQDQALAVRDVPELQSAVADAEQKIGKP